MMNREKFVSILNENRKNGNVDYISISAKTILSEIDTQETRQNKKLNSDEIMSLIKKESRKFVESSESFRDAGKNEESNIYKKCAEFLDEFLPKMVPESEYQNVINDVFEQGDNIGNVMKKTKEKYKSTIDYKSYSQFVKNFLS